MLNRGCCVLMLLLLGALASSGCAWTYNYGGRTYKVPDEALAAHRADVRRAIDRIPRAAMALPDSIAVSLPSREVVQRHGIVVTGGSRPPESAIKYLVDMIEQGNAGYADALRASNVFSNVQLLPPDSDPPAAKAIGSRYFVSLTMPSASQESLTLQDLTTGEKRRVQLVRRNLDSVFSSFVDEVIAVLKLWGVNIQ